MGWRCLVIIGDVVESRAIINPEQAIGMDGEAFLLARAGIERLREARAHCRVDGPAVLPEALINHGLALAFGRFDSQQGSRLPLVAGLLAGESVAVIAERLGKAPQTLYKTIQDDLDRLVEEITADAYGDHQQLWRIFQRQNGGIAPWIPKNATAGAEADAGARQGL